MTTTKSTSIAAALVLAFSCVLSASCLRGTSEAETTASPASEAERGNEPSSSEPIGEAPEADEAVGEAQEDLQLFKIIRCTGPELGAACERKCGAAGVWCPSRFTHPRRPRDGGDGELFQCRALAGARTCWYYYEAIDEKCIRAMGTGVTFCSDQDERP
jgi:hypothetical protein